VTSYKLLGTDHCITDGGERGGFGIHNCRGKNQNNKYGGLSFEWLLSNICMYLLNPDWTTFCIQMMESGELFGT
jgi:hypothetical protein